MNMSVNIGLLKLKHGTQICKYGPSNRSGVFQWYSSGFEFCFGSYLRSEDLIRVSGFFPTGRSSNNIGCLALKETEVSKSPDLTLSFACLNLFCLPDFVPYFICWRCVYFSFCLLVCFEVHCVKRVELLLLCTGSRSVSARRALVRVQAVMFVFYLNNLVLDHVIKVLHCTVPCAAAWGFWRMLCVCVCVSTVVFCSFLSSWGSPKGQNERTSVSRLVTAEATVGLEWHPAVKSLIS